VSRVVVDLGQLDDLIEAMQRFESHLMRARAQADARMRVLHESWTGAAAATQAAAHARWDVGAGDVHEALAVLRSIAATAHANYSAAMLANRRMWSL
jgi:uncharacterized protein YukE